MIDSGQYPELARHSVADIRASKLPTPKYRLNTQWRGDHLLANFVFDQAFSGLVVLQHAETARLGPVNYKDWNPANQSVIAVKVKICVLFNRTFRSSIGRPLRGVVIDNEGARCIGAR